MSLGPYLLYIVRLTPYVWIRSGGVSSLRRMGEVQRDAPPFPSMLLSKHICSVKKTTICSIRKGCRRVTARYNLVEPGSPISPLQGGPAFLLLASQSCGAKSFLCTARVHRDESYIRLR
jgi:hypothetical protein